MFASKLKILDISHINFMQLKLINDQAYYDPRHIEIGSKSVKKNNSTQ